MRHLNPVGTICVTQVNSVLKILVDRIRPLTTQQIRICSPYKSRDRNCLSERHTYAATLRSIT